MKSNETYLNQEVHEYKRLIVSGFPDETDVVIEITHLPQYIEPIFLAMRETMEKAIAKHGKVVIEGNS